MEPTRDRDAIRAALRRDPALHVYELGDLDDFFWPRTTWYLHDGEVALLYAAPGLPVLAAFAHDARVLDAILAVLPLPHRLYSHLTPGLALPSHVAESRSPHQKMALGSPNLDDAAGERLGPDDASELARFYAHAYPGNWFDPRMLETGQYFALREDGAIAAVAGVHVYSASERVAALGNIATAPSHRGRGLAGRVTARLCASLRETVDVIGLNVLSGNAAAIRCYQRLGFVHVADYEEAVQNRMSM